MPNHVHALIRLRPDVRLRSICRQWLSLSATRINHHLTRTGHFWQSEPFDHILRGPEKLLQCRKYIAENPRHLHPADFTLDQGTLFRTEPCIHFAQPLP